MRKKMLASVLALVLFSSLTAQTTDKAQKFQPTLGQQGKDVIWMPTPEALVEAMLDMAKATSEDFVIDLGSGDGRIPIAAAKRGIRALGIEYNPDMVSLSRENAQKEGVSDKAAFLQGDIFETDFSRATVLTMYLLPSLNMRLRPTILDMKPGTRVVSHAFSMEDWEADQTVEAESRYAYLWIVPAKVGGAWTWAANGGGIELTLSQTFQKIEGSLTSGGLMRPLKKALLVGDRISFAVEESPTVTREYSGRVLGEAIRGTSKGTEGIATEWVATRRTLHPIEE
jgi:SAM-dependent methyltransferase